MTSTTGLLWPTPTNNSTFSVTMGPQGPVITTVTPYSSGTYTAVGNTGTGYITTSAGNSFYVGGTGDLIVDPPIPMRELEVYHGEEKAIKLPDGTVIEVEANGSFKINDSQAKVVYKANRIREFNKYLNASDLLEEFIKFCGLEGVRQGEMLELPVKLFVGWLVQEAAKADDQPAPDGIMLIPMVRSAAFPRCVSCGRFIRHEFKRRRIEFCGTPCFERRLARVTS